MSDNDNQEQASGNQAQGSGDQPQSKFEEQLQKGIQLVEERKFNESLEIARELQGMESDAAEGFHLEAIVMQHQQQWHESVVALDKALQNAENDAGLYNLRGFAYMSMDKLDEAESDFDQAVELENFEPAHRNKVLLKILQNKGNEAIDYLIDRIKQKPSDPENWIMMGDLMRRGGQEEKARSYYEQAQKLDPNNEYVKKMLNQQDS